MTANQISHQRRQSVRQIIRMLKPCSLFTQAEVARFVGLTRERVAQIEREALWKIHKRLNELTQGEVD